VIEVEGADTRRDRASELWLEVQFDFLGTTVQLLSANVEHLQHWCAVYSEFRVSQRSPDITIRVCDAAASFAPRGVTIETPDGISLWDGRGPLLPPLHAPGLNRYVYLQGAATGHSGHAVLIVGGRRSGKTTLAMASAAGGARLLADDVVPIDPDDLLALPWPKALALPASVFEMLGLHASMPGLVPFVTRAGDVLWRVAPSTLFGRRLSRSPADVAAIVFLDSDREDGGSGLIPVAPGDAFERLVRHLEVRPGERERTADALVRLCRRVPALALGRGDPAEGAALLDELIR
jgi:hypothetical protein